MMRFRHFPCHLLCLTLLTGSLTAQAQETPPAGDAAQPTAPEQRAPLSERSDLEALALERQLATGEQQQLDAAGSRFLALWRPANDAEPKGLVILLPDDDESADGPQGVGPLRRKLPDVGWHSLSLSLPDPQGALLPVRQAETPAAEKPAAEQTAPGEPAQPTAPTEQPSAASDSERAAHVQRIFARIDAGIAFAGQQQARHIVLLGHGSGAYWAARYIAERTPGNVNDLLLVDTRQPEGFSTPVNELMPQLKARIGDFYYRDSAAARQAALLRKQVSQRSKNAPFVQVGLDALPGNPEVAAEQLLRRLRGWLDKEVAGEK